MAKRETQMPMVSSCCLCGSRNFLFIDMTSKVCKCMDCGYLFRNPTVRVEDIIAHYSCSDEYNDWVACSRGRDFLWKRRLKKMRCYKKPGNILDVGTGIGQFLNYARHHFSEVYGTEVSNNAIEIAEREYGLNIFKGELDKIDFNGMQFDNISLFHVLEHVPDPKHTISTCRRLLKDDGVIFIAVPNEIVSLKARIRRYIKKALKALGNNKFEKTGELGVPKLICDGSLKEIHLSFFTPEVLVNFLEAEGFAVINRSLDPYFAQRGYRLFLYTAEYLFYSLLLKIFRTNVYDCIWVAAKKERVERYRS